MSMGVEFGGLKREEEDCQLSSGFTCLQNQCLRDVSLFFVDMEVIH